MPCFRLLIEFALTFLLLITLSPSVQGQCAPSSADIVITGASSSNYTLFPADTMHLASGADYTGNVTMRGGVLFNCASMAQNMTITSILTGDISTVYNHGVIDMGGANDHKDIEIHNHGTFYKTGDLTMNSDATFYNHGTLDISGKVKSNADGEFRNYGLLIAGGDLKSEIAGRFFNFDGGILTAQKFSLKGYFYNSGQVNCNQYDGEPTATTENEGGCWNVSTKFKNKGTIEGLHCGDFSIAGVSDNQGSINGVLALLDPSATSFPYIDVNSGTVSAMVVGSSCGCPGVSPVIEDCTNGIDDDGDGKIDSDDPECMDCDGDLVTNAYDIDDDNDGVLDSDEEQSNTDPAAFYGSLDPIPDGATNILTGTTITYNKTFPPEDINSQPYGYYVESPVGETDFKEFQMSFSPPISDVSFKLEYVDNIKEEFNLIVYDEFDNAYDLRKEGLIHLGSYLDQEGDGSEFRTNATVIGAGGMGFDLEQATARFNFPGKVSRIHYDLKALDGTNYRVGKPYYHFIDTDADGVIDKCDLDSDNDGIYDVTEAGGVDADLDGIIGSGIITDTDGDGWSDIVDGDDGGVALLDTDVDTDGKRNRVDDDSDGDGCDDVIEAGFPDGDGDGELGSTAPPTVDSNGVVTSGGS